jgi:hypothetical protein
MDNKLSEKADAIIAAFADVIVETLVEAEGSPLGGVPAGHLYAALMAHMSLDTFSGMMAEFASQGLIALVGHLYIAGPKAHAWLIERNKAQ